LRAAAAPPHRGPMSSPSPAPLSPEQLFQRFDALGIACRTYTHPPVFAVAEAVTLRGQLPGGHCKSLFLKDKKGGFGWSWRSRSGRST
jgi:Ala-tRNA(Pro) deacylase